MKRFLVLSLSGLLLSSAASFAGSMNVVSEPEIMPMPEPVFDWGGAYGGVALGFGQGTYTQGVSVLGELGVDVDVSGAIVAAKLGYNIQNGNTVFGVEADISSGPSGVTPQFTTGPDWSCNTGDCYVDINSVASLRARAGFTPSPDMLLYATGGLAVAQVTGGILASAQDGGGSASGAVSGVGMEFAAGNNASFGAEYLYYNISPIPFGVDGLGNTFDGVGDFGVLRFFFNKHF